MKTRLKLLLRLTCLFLLALASGTTTSFASIERYDYPAQHLVLIGQSALITQAIPDPAPAEQQPSFLATFALLATTEPSQSHLYANAHPSLGNQAESSPSAQQPADATASFIGQNGQLVGAEGVGLAPDIAATFSGGKYTSIVLQDSMTAYRYSGGVSSATGRFLTTADTVSQISSPAAASLALRLPVGATANTLNSFIIPGGTRIFIGGVAGGADTATQIFIENAGVLIPK